MFHWEAVSERILTIYDKVLIKSKVYCFCFETWCIFASSGLRVIIKMTKKNWLRTEIAISHLNGKDCIINNTCVRCRTITSFYWWVPERYTSLFVWSNGYLKYRHTEINRKRVEKRGIKRDKCRQCLLFDFCTVLFWFLKKREEKTLTTCFAEIKTYHTVQLLCVPSLQHQSRHLSAPEFGHAQPTANTKAKHRKNY